LTDGSQKTQRTDSDPWLMVLKKTQRTGSWPTILKKPKELVLTLDWWFSRNQVSTLNWGSISTRNHAKEPTLNRRFFHEKPHLLICNVFKNLKLEVSFWFWKSIKSKNKNGTRGF
jgi:hypothetical protein